MLNALALFALLTVTAPVVERADAVRMGLFRLFKPATLQARIATGKSATLDVGSRAGNLALTPGETVSIKLVSNRLRVTISDALGRIIESLDASEARIYPSGATCFEVSLPGKMKRVVRGELLVGVGERSMRGALKIILTTDREAAVASVVAAESDGERVTESLKALAVVARTFMLSHPNRHADEGFDFCDTTHCQFYRGETDLAAEAATPAVASAVAATAGEYLSYGGEPVESYFTAACGGMTATPEMVWGGASKGYPYHRIDCRWCRGSRFDRWARSASAASVLEALSLALGFKLSPAAEIILASDEPNGFVRAITIKDARHRATMSADQFRRAIGQRLGWNTVISPSFMIEHRGNRMIFRGRGFGSQVGMCLAGAVAQAKAGRSYRDILRFYYPQTALKDRSTNE